LEPISGSAGGWCDPKRRRIVVDAGLPANAQVRVLVHELAHALGVGYAQFGRARAEVIVDTVTFVGLSRGRAPSRWRVGAPCRLTLGAQ
jgi:hypothetical protein